MRANLFARRTAPFFIDVQEQATPLAGAGIETGVEVHVTGDVADDAASGGAVPRLVCCLYSFAASPESDGTG